MNRTGQLITVRGVHHHSYLPHDCYGLAQVGDKGHWQAVQGVYLEGPGGGQWRQLLFFLEWVQQIQYGNLGILNLETLGWAFRNRWLWLQKTDADSPWTCLLFKFHKTLRSRLMSQLSLLSEMGSPPCYGVGRDSWLQGKNISVLAPNFNNLIPKRAIKQHSVSQVLAAWRWVNAINIPSLSKS